MDTQASVPERVLVARAQAGNEEAFTELVRRHSGQVYGLSLNMLRNREDAEDNLQNVLVKAFHHIDRFEGNSQFSTWLVRITINEALMKLRRTSSEKLHLQPESEVPHYRPEDLLPTRQTNPEAQCIARDLAHKACTSVPTTLRDTFTMFAVEGWTQKELSKSHGVATQTIKSRIFRARRMMKETLRGAVGSAEA